jgi:hypothetical protein
MESRNEKYPVKDNLDFIGLTVYALVIIGILALVSCESVAPNTYAALEALPEEAFTPLWMVLEGLCLDLFNLVKGLIL